MHIKYILRFNIDVQIRGIKVQNTIENLINMNRLKNVGDWVVYDG